MVYSSFWIISFPWLKVYRRHSFLNSTHPRLFRSSFSSIFRLISTSELTVQATSCAVSVSLYFSNNNLLHICQVSYCRVWNILQLGLLWLYNKRQFTVKLQFLYKCKCFTRPSQSGPLIRNYSIYVSLDRVIIFHPTNYWFRFGDSVQFLLHCCCFSFYCKL